LAKNAKTFRRFEAERPNQIWQSDILYGPYLPDPNQPEKNKRTYLVAFIDDFSRLVPHAEFYWDEKFPTLENTFKIAMLKRGMPEIIYVDNGKVYHARQLDAVCASLGIQRWRDQIGNFLRQVGEKELVELFLWQVNRKVNNVGLVSVQGLEFEVNAMLHNRQVEVRYNPFDLTAVHIYYQGRFFQKAVPAKISRWNLAAKAKTTSPPPATPTGVKPLQQLAAQHHTQKQQHVQQLVGAAACTEEPSLTLPQFIHLIASALGKNAEAFHPREIDAVKTFFATHQPLQADEVGIAMAKAVLTYGATPQHIDVYLDAIKAVHLKWQSQEKKS